MTNADNGEAGEGRAATLRALVRLEVDPRTAKTALARYGWDAGEDLIILTPTDIALMLNRYLNAELTDGDWQLWAETLEGRDDVGFDEESGELIKEFLFQSAAPEIFEPLTPSLARRWLSRLGQGLQ